jgi:hypothetical protein
VLTLDVANTDGLPGAPVAVVLNVTAVGPSASTFITVYPGLLGRPNASDLNAASGTVSTNLVVVGVGANGTINLFNDVGNVNLIVDVFGYYS